MVLDDSSGAITPEPCPKCPWAGRNPEEFEATSADTKRRVAAGQFVICRHGGSLPPKACWGALAWAQSPEALPYKPSVATIAPERLLEDES